MGGGLSLSAQNARKGGKGQALPPNKISEGLPVSLAFIGARNLSARLVEHSLGVSSPVWVFSARPDQQLAED